MNKIYLDYAASTPMAPEVLRAMEQYFAEKFGNPGSFHSFGQEAIAAVDMARETIAKAIGADFREIIFTGSATEANNLALRGAVMAARKNIASPRVVVSLIEHESVLETVRALEGDGIEVIYLPVDRRGIIDLEKLKESLNERTIFVSLMYANNEIGTIEPIKEISKIISDFRGQNIFPLLHTDAVQAFQFLDCNIKNLGLDLMTLSAHKIYGPKGIGLLYIRTGSKLSPIMAGGGQEFGLRSGTENVPLIVGFAMAVELALAAREPEAKRIAEFRDYFWQELKKNCPSAEINGLEDNSLRLPNILNVYFPDYQAEDLLAKFDLAGLAVSAGSACRSRRVESSYVIEALGYSEERAKRSIRFSFGRPTTKEEIERTLAIIKAFL